MLIYHLVKKQGLDICESRANDILNSERIEQPLRNYKQDNN